MIETPESCEVQVARARDSLDASARVSAIRRDESLTSRVIRDNVIRGKHGEQAEEPPVEITIPSGAGEDPFSCRTRCVGLAANRFSPWKIPGYFLEGNCRILIRRLRRLSSLSLFPRRQVVATRLFSDREHKSTFAAIIASAVLPTLR